MFDDLNKQNPSSPSAAPAVDDIFAETDKPTPAPAPTRNQSAAPIDAHKVGLMATAEIKPEPAAAPAGQPWFKITVIAIVAVIVILGGYLLYTKFSASGTATPPAPLATNSNHSSSPAPTVGSPVTTGNNGTAGNNPSGTSSVAANAPASSWSATASVPLIPGVNAPAATSSPLATSSNPTVASNSPATIPPLDSDQDGLSDAEEKIYGTNIYSADTDSDGLSDYEEVKIYHTDPLNPDTDGDGFTDGQEIKSGYNPLGAGKMTGTTSPAVGQ